MKRTKQPRLQYLILIKLIVISGNENVCKDKMSTLPQIKFNNKYNQEFKIVGDIPKNRILNL